MDRCETEKFIQRCRLGPFGDEEPVRMRSEITPRADPQVSPPGGILAELALKMNVH